MGWLDSLLRSLNLLALDAGNPLASVFTSAVPTIPSRSPRRPRRPSPERIPPSQAQQSPVDSQSMTAHDWSPVATHPPITFPSTPPFTDAQLFNGHTQPPTQSYPSSQPHAEAQPPVSAIPSSCHCIMFTLGHSWGMVQEFAPLWDMTPTWQSEWTESDIRREECRRLVWSSVMLSAGHSAYTAARSEDSDVQQLFLMDPRNVGALPEFPTAKPLTACHFALLLTCSTPSFSPANRSITMRPTLRHRPRILCGRYICGP